MIEVATVAELNDYLDTSHQCPLNRCVDRAMLQAFLDISLDRSSLHLPESSKPIIPGNLLISLLPAMLQSGLIIHEDNSCKTVALNNTRFYNSVTVDQFLELEFVLKSIRKRQNQYFVCTELRLRCEGKRVLSAEQTDCYFTG